MRNTQSLIALTALSASTALSATIDVRDHGAKGDGKSIDSPAINAAIDTAARTGGGTVLLPRGVYLSFSIHLQSGVTLNLDEGATLKAATPAPGVGEYDAPEPNEFGDRLQYQDFGHSHWHNSLIWAENAHDVAIVGKGLIDGTALLREAGYSKNAATGPNGTLPPGAKEELDSRQSNHEPNQADKAIAIKNSTNVKVSGISVLRGGHFAMLVTGVDGLTVSNVTIDTNRDGIDIDASRNVVITHCVVNSPQDDAIVLKASYALGSRNATENVDISHRTVLGFDIGTVLDGTRKRTLTKAPDQDGPTGRIKIGTESNGDFRNIKVSDCTFERSRGLALETVDGGVIENVTIDHVRMSDINNPVVFMRIGNRARGPEGTGVGSIRRVRISNVHAQGADSRYAAILLAGLPQHPIEDVELSNIEINARGGLTSQIVSQQPADLVNPLFLGKDEPGATGPRDPSAVPERERGYPEPSMFGLLPSSVIYARHVRLLKMAQTRVSFERPDTRPRVVLDDISKAEFGTVDY